MTLDLSAYPQCAKRLHFQRCRMDDKGFNAFWAAACVAEDFTDEDLTAFGGFDFDTRTEENGYRQLGRLEQFMAHRRAVAQQNENSPEFYRRHQPQATNTRERVKSLIGAYGVKAGKIALDDEFWAVASVLWPGRIVKPAVPRLSDLVDQITAIDKKDRREARDNRKALPAHLRSDVADTGASAAQCRKAERLVEA